MRDPIKISLSSPKVKIGGVIAGNVLVPPTVCQEAYPKIHLALSTQAKTSDGWEGVMLAESVLQDVDPAPGCSLDFEIDVPINTPLTMAFTRIVIEANWLGHPGAPSVYSLALTGDKPWDSLWESLRLLGLDHTPTSGTLMKAMAGPLAGRIIQPFVVRPSGHLLSGTLDSLEIVWERDSPQSQVAYLAANRPPGWFAGAGPHLNHYVESSMAEGEMWSPDLLNGLLVDALQL